MKTINMRRALGLCFTWLILILLVSGNPETSDAAGKVIYVRNIDDLVTPKTLSYPEDKWGEIWEMNEDGTELISLNDNTNSTSNSAPVLSPKGAKIAFIDNVANALKLMKSDGSDVRSIYAFSEGYTSPGGLAWSPNGTKLAFSMGTANQYDIYTVDLNGSTLTKLTTGGYNYDPSFSPDGAKIVYCHRETEEVYSNELYIINADGSGNIKLTDSCCSEATNKTAPDWAPSQTIIFSSGHNIVTIDPETTITYSLSIDGDFPSQQNELPKWSPDTSMVAFTRSGKNNTQKKMFSSVSDGSGRVTISPKNDGFNYFVSDWGIPLTSTLECNYSILPEGKSFDDSGGTGSINVTADSECDWTAAVDEGSIGWITISSGVSGIGNGVVTYTVFANETTNLRSGTITIAGHSYSVTQSGQVVCTYTISQDEESFSYNGGEGAVTVTSYSECAWSSSVDEEGAGWITIASGNNGTGEGVVSFTVSPNISFDQRIGTMTIAGQVFTVTQEGSACIFILSKDADEFDSHGGDGSVDITAEESCAWNTEVEQSSSSWITITSGGNGSGFGTVSYSLSANIDRNPRTGHITIAGEDYVVEQTGALPEITSLSSDAGTYADELTISGSGFGGVIGKVTILSGEVETECDVSSWSDTEIKIAIPWGVTPGAVFIYVATSDGDKSENGAAFTYNKPLKSKINKVSKSTVKKGSEILLYGRSFGPVEGDIIVTGAKMSIVVWTDDTIILSLDKVKKKKITLRVSTIYGKSNIKTLKGKVK